ncbi:MAG: hypothetical protein OXN25_24715 [Candidatus Poribacteria bacterium]|nr:hypothetical protein [Candidatus Poribacteria bacterium]
MRANKHEGSNFWDHLKEKGIYEEVQELAEERYGHLYQKGKTSFFGKIRKFLSSIAGFFIN